MRLLSAQGLSGGRLAGQTTARRSSRAPTRQPARRADAKLPVSAAQGEGAVDAAVAGKLQGAGVADRLQEAAAALKGVATEASSSAPAAKQVAAAPLEAVGAAAGAVTTAAAATVEAVAAGSGKSGELVAVADAPSSGDVAAAVQKATAAVQEATTAVQAAKPSAQAAKQVAAAATDAKAGLELPKLDLPAFELPKVELPSVDAGALFKDLPSPDTLVDPAALSSTAGAAASGLQKAIAYVQTTPTDVLGEELLALLAVVYLTPPLAKAGLKAARGFAGEVFPTTALDALVSQGNNALIDIRSASEKESGGVPDLADSGKVVELEYVTVADSKVSSQLRNATDVEVELTAVEIAALRKLNKGMTLYLLDGAGNTSKAVARELTRRGFGNVWVIKGGYQAWTAAKLRTKSWNTPAALLPDAATSAASLGAM